MPHLELSLLNQNLRLYYEVHGTGKTKILFIMGMLTDGAAWHHQTDFFLGYPDYQSVSYDNRGFGRSSSPLTLQYSTTQMAKDALALADHLQWTEFHVVSISMGGMIALELALLVPKRVLSLTLLATHAGGLAALSPLISIKHIIQAILFHDEHSLVENALTFLYGAKTLADPNRRKSFYDYHVQKFRKRSPPSLIGFLGQTSAVSTHYISYANLLRLRYCPFECLVMVGTEDRIVRESNSYLLRKVMGCRLIRLENAGHGLQGECAEEINQELLNLFESARRRKEEIPDDYAIEIEALEHCCQHRTHCVVDDFLGFLKGLLLGIILYSLLLLIGITKTNFAGIYPSLEWIILVGCLNGLHRAVRCVLNAFRARRFVRDHRLQLARAAHHGGVGIVLPEESKKGIPYGCGFDFPVHSLIFIIMLISLISWLGLNERKNFAFNVNNHPSRL